ncbi:hypothetical protein Bcav_3524 [Beutenbergia cavernae DSM 12333]|uniref:Uncharacterized protein n=1 Tax=Beutenbergia cavernae (strain ATCC BAA-8 / DSM 12333 / CCUG 43141 / JCM 11478 / NBRC 16432 / NCIMB 13614 / HKI 0122) TaxID=471853 RepID=C5C2S2_BEUC1|nr:hypothetical protein [Beutenbergia cavernae]ACQ81766.1 hypothetical protein Bcav_3524 [Beutenbergia cavernae DSM 12333]
MTSPQPDDPREAAAPTPEAGAAVEHAAGAVPEQAAGTAPEDAAGAGPEDQEPTAGADEADDGERVVISDVADPGHVRRAPRYGSFAFAGIVVGGILALLLVQFRALRVVIPPPGPSLDAGGLFLLTWVYLGILGAFVGLGLALWLDRRSMRRR